MKKKLIVLFILVIIILLGTITIFIYRSKNSEEVFEFDAQIGDIYSDNNVTMEPIKIGDLTFIIPTIKVEGSKLAVTLRFDFTEINSLNFYYFLYNTKNNDDVLLIMSHLYNDRFDVLDKFAKDNNLPKNNSNFYFSTDKISNFVAPDCNSYNENEYEIVVYSEYRDGNDYDINLLKDGLKLQLFNIDYQPTGKDVVKLDNQYFRINLHYN